MTEAANDAFCIDCPELPNGTRKRPICCRRVGAEREYKIGDRVPMPPVKLDVRPNAPVDNRPTFSPARHPQRAPGK